MAKYITFFSYTADAVKAMIHHPSDRAAAIVEKAKVALEAYTPPN